MTHNTVLASATHTGGELRHIYHYFYRAFPTFWQHWDLAWHQVDQAVDRYGFTQDITKEHVSDARTTSGQVERTTTRIEVPGWSPQLLPLVLQHAAFIGIIDVGATLPLLEEIPVLVPLEDATLAAYIPHLEDHRNRVQADLTEARDQDRSDVTPLETELAQVEQQLAGAPTFVQQRNLAAAYTAVTAALEDMAKQGNSAAMLAKGNLPGAFAVAPMLEPAYTVNVNVKNEWGRVIGQERLITFPVLAATWEYPLERELRQIVQTERTQHRRVMIYFDQNRKHNVGARLREVLHAYNPWCLPDMAPEDREAAIQQAVEHGHTVVLVPYRQVVEGLNLQCHLDTIIWYELAQSHYVRDQASRRIYRLGKTFPAAVPVEARSVRIYYLAYAGSTAHKKLDRLGKQNGAAMLFAGDTPDGALVQAAGADQSALAQVSATLEQAQADVADDTALLLDPAALADAFARRNAERHALLQAGRQWIGVTDHLPALLAELRGTGEAAPHLARGASEQAQPPVIEETTPPNTHEDQELELLTPATHDDHKLAVVFGNPVALQIRKRTRRRKPVLVVSDQQLPLFE